MTSATAGFRWRADLALGGIALIWGATFVVVKEALADISTFLFLALRFSLAAVALSLAFRGRYGSFPPARKTLPAGALAGLCLFLGYLLQTVGLRYTTASKSAFITGLSVVMVPLFVSAVYRSVPHVSEGIGVALATAGMALLTMPAGRLEIGYGDLLTMGCAAAFAGHIMLVGHFSRRIGFESLSLFQIATAALIALGSFWWIEIPRIRWTAGLVSAVIVTGLLATALAFTAQSWAQRHTTPTRTALILALEPVFAWLASFLALGEILPGRAAVGAVLILSGILIVELKPIGSGRHRSY